ncbi:nuclear transport factor 2 family protein [Cupriavidus necator]
MTDSAIQDPIHGVDRQPDALTRMTWSAECTRLCMDFAHFVDHREYAKVAALFTSTGAFTRNGETLRGHEAILNAMHSRPMDIETRHVCTNVRVDIDASTASASGTSYLTLFRGPKSGDGTAAAPVIAEFDDRYERTSEGWRIASRIVTAAF